MGLAMFSALRNQHSQGTLPGSRWEIENAIDRVYVPVQSRDPAVPVPE